MKQTHSLRGMNKVAGSQMQFVDPLQFWEIFSAAMNENALGSDDDLTRNPDGSITLYVQHDDPGPGKQANWLPAPSGPFYLILRNCAPAPEVVEALQNPAAFLGPPPLIAVH